MKLRVTFLAVNLYFLSGICVASDELPTTIYKQTYSKQQIYLNTNTLLSSEECKELKRKKQPVSYYFELEANEATKLSLLKLEVCQIKNETKDLVCVDQELASLGPIQDVILPGGQNLVTVKSESYKTKDECDKVLIDSFTKNSYIPRNQKLKLLTRKFQFVAPSLANDASEKPQKEVNF